MPYSHVHHNRSTKATTATVLALMIATTLLSACNGNVKYSVDRAVNEQGWSMNDRLTFDVQIDDTLTLYNIFVDLRVSNTYPYSNAFLFVNTTFPDGSVAADTLECPLAAADGQWLGRKVGHYIDNRYYLKKLVAFPMKGTYQFEMFHGMRDTAIAGISTVGLRLERTEHLLNNTVTGQQTQ